MKNNDPRSHSFLKSPNRTLLTLSFPVLMSLVAEPITGLVDTAFVARLGTSSLAALGVGAMALSSLFWIFNFLGIGTQTEVARSQGRKDYSRAAQHAGTALSLGLFFGLLTAVVGYILTGRIVVWMGAEGELARQAEIYMNYRWPGAPAVILTLTCFGALRGLQDMKTPLYVAIGVNVVNIVLDPVLIFGVGPFPEWGIKGAAVASSLSQWIGAVWAMASLFKQLGFPDGVRLKDAGSLLQIGGDLFVRTGLLTLFLLLATRAATRVGAEAGAAHQAVRQVWIFAALFLDSFAITGQSLVAFFLGAESFHQARNVARSVCLWSFGTGIVLGLGMWILEPLAIQAWVPSPAVPLFIPAWRIAAVMQPVNSISFATDGVHWGTGDFRLLRNGVIAATSVGAFLLWLIDLSDPQALTWIWVATSVWILVRAAIGFTRIWPGFGKAPLKQST